MKLYEILDGNRKDKMFSCIYLWTNLENGKHYVGQATHFYQRMTNYKNKGATPKLQNAINKYGIDNFDIIILEKCNVDSLDEREQYWMDFYQTLDKNKGYNVLRAEETPGENFSQGSKNNRAVLTEDEVDEIRVSIYCDRQDPLKVFAYYKDKISYDAFCKAYRGETWKNVDSSMIYDLNKTKERKCKSKAKLSVDDVKLIRERAKNGESITSIFLDYSEICGRNTIKRVVNNETWKNI